MKARPFLAVLLALGLLALSLGGGAWWLVWQPEQRRALREQRQRAWERLQGKAEDYRLPRQASADVFTSSISALVANGVQYRPRPIPQSYSTYTQALQGANEAFYANQAISPEYVVLDVGDIDGRLPISLDSPALRQVMRHYRFSHRGSRGAIVLRRSIRSGDSAFTPVQANRALLSQQQGEMGWTRQGSWWRSSPKRCCRARPPGHPSAMASGSVRSIQIGRAHV